MAERATIILEARTEEAVEDVSRLEAALDEMGSEARFAGQGFDELEDDAARQLTELRTQAERTAQSTRQLGASAGGTANQLATEIGQASQDAAFGLSNIANQLPLISEQFTRLQDQAGGTGAALKSLGSSLTGPAGIIAGISLLLTFKDEIVAFFNDASDSAEEAASKFEDAASSLLSFQEDIAGFEVETLAQARQVRDTLQSRVDTRETEVSQLESLLEVRTATGANQARLRRETRQEARAIEEKLGLQDASVSRVRDALEGRQDTLAKEQQILSRAESLVESRQIEKDVAETLEATSANRADNEEDTAAAAREQLRALQEIERIQAAISGTTQRDALPTQVVADTQQDIAGRATDLAGSDRELGRGFAEGNEGAKEFGEQARQEIAQTISAAGQLGAALASAFDRGKKGAQEVAAILLQSIGGFITAIPGFGQILGPGLAAGGQFIGSFQHGGRVNTPLQIVGESGPELAALPQGTQVSTNRETERIMQQAGGGMTDAVVQKLDEVAARVEQMDVRIDAFQARKELQRAEQKVASSYPPSP